MKLDQHFLTNEAIARGIVSFLNVKDKESVLEIGPGKGILSQYIKRATLVEIDSGLAEELKNNLDQ